jgi:hypothetical protein
MQLSTISAQIFYYFMTHLVFGRNIFRRCKAYLAAEDWHFKSSGKNDSKFLKKSFLCNKAPVTAVTMGELIKDTLPLLE